MEENLLMGNSPIIFNKRGCGFIKILPGPEDSFGTKKCSCSVIGCVVAGFDS